VQLELIAADSGSSHPQGSAERGERVHNVWEIARLDVEASVAISEDGNAIVTFTETPVSAGAACAYSACRLGIFGHKLGTLNFPQSQNAGWVFHIFCGCF
jgi:hypothetical protein